MVLTRPPCPTSPAPFGAASRHPVALVHILVRRGLIRESVRCCSSAITCVHVFRMSACCGTGDQKQLDTTSAREAGVVHHTRVHQPQWSVAVPWKSAVSVQLLKDIWWGSSLIRPFAGAEAPGLNTMLSRQLHQLRASPGLGYCCVPRAARPVATRQQRQHSATVVQRSVREQRLRCSR